MAAQSFYKGITPVTSVKHTTAVKSVCILQYAGTLQFRYTELLARDHTAVSVPRQAVFACPCRAAWFGASSHSPLSHNFSLLCLKNGTFAAFFPQKERLAGVEFVKAEKDDCEMAFSM